MTFRKIAADISCARLAAAPWSHSQGWREALWRSGLFRNLWYVQSLQGAGWFESQLVDYDVCSNWGNWVSAAGLAPGRTNRFNIPLQVPHTAVCPVRLCCDIRADCCRRKACLAKIWRS